MRVHSTLFLAALVTIAASFAEFGCDLGRQTGRDFLIGTAAEPISYGLYSYLLFGSKPIAADRDRYVALVKASLELIDTTDAVRKSSSPSQLNIYLLPVIIPVPSSLFSLQPDASEKAANWLVDEYNGPRARNILDAVVSGCQRGGARYDGIYIVSVPKAVGSGQNVEGPCLWQDLSGISTNVATAYIQHFLNQAAKPNFWQENRRDEFVLDAVNFLERAAREVNQTVPALATAIVWLTPHKPDASTPTPASAPK